MNVGYNCKKCGTAVIVIDGQAPIRGCKCNTTIVMDLNCIASGKSKLKHGV